jgi:ADP-heptose:LPS heptosyltransferase
MRILYGLGDGLGNIIQSTPALYQLSKYHEVHVLCTETSPDAHKVLGRSDIVKKIFTDHQEVPLEKYNRIVSTIFCKPFLVNTVGMAWLTEKEWLYHIRAAQTVEPKVVPEPTFWAAFKEPARAVTSASGGDDIIIPGGKPKFLSKRYPRFRELAEFLESKGRSAVFAGTKHDLEGLEGIQQYPQIVEPDLLELGAYLKNARTVIGNDCGPIHYAGALGVPAFALFGPSSMLKNLPPTITPISIDVPPPCMPCQVKDVHAWTKGSACKQECFEFGPEHIYRTITETTNDS